MQHDASPVDRQTMRSSSTRGCVDIDTYKALIADLGTQGKDDGPTHLNNVAYSRTAPSGIIPEVTNERGGRPRPPSNASQILSPGFNYERTHNPLFPMNRTESPLRTQESGNMLPAQGPALHSEGYTAPPNSNTSHLGCSPGMASRSQHSSRDYRLPGEDLKVEHSLLVYRMGSKRYLRRCLEEGLDVDFKATNPDPLSSDNMALEPVYSPWIFRKLDSLRSSAPSSIPLPSLGVNDVELVGRKAGANHALEHRHVTIRGCRAYYVPVTMGTSRSAVQYVCHYAVPMYLLDLMERGSTGYNTFYHRAECPCYTGFSSMAIQMGASSLVLSSPTPSSPKDAEEEDYTAISLGATHFTEVTISCVPYMTPYVYLEGSLCKDGTCLSRLGVSDYRPSVVCGHVDPYPPMVPRLKVLCVFDD